MTPATPAPTDAGALADALEPFLRVAAVMDFYVPEAMPDMTFPRAECETSYPSEPRCVALTIEDFSRLRQAAALRNSAPQETRGDEPVAWRLLMGDGDWAYHSGPKPTLLAWEDLYAAPQQSPRLEREGIAKAIHARRYHLDAKDTDSMFAWYAENPQGTDRSRLAIYSAFQDADAILALLSPDTSVVSSTGHCEVGK